MNNFFFLSFMLFLAPSLFAKGTVTKINNASQLLAKVTHEKGFQTNERVMIISAKEQKVIAFGDIHDLHLKNDDLIAKIDIIEIIDHSLVSVGDDVEVLNLRLLESKKVPGLNSLTLKGSHKIPAQYKELAYMGVFSADGHTLDKHETLASPFQFQYGVTDNTTVKIVNSLFLDGYLNMGAKHQIAHNQYMKLTANIFGAYKLDKQDWIGQFGGILTLPSNAKFETHWVANFTFDPQFANAKATKGLGLYQDSDIRSVTEYITDSWNRILFGPTYNVELQSFGGTLSYMWIWDVFHMSLGMATKDFSKLSIGTKSYYYVYDFFWRF